MNITSLKITVTGLVQGVGFRPFVYRIATKHHLKGWVKNTNESVEIAIQGEYYNVSRFLDALSGENPPASVIESVRHVPYDNIVHHSFDILPSDNVSDEITEVSPDIAVCHDCLTDMETQPHRYGYPFINCTNCGPRFTIIRDLPYDRPLTTMNSFTMCSRCNNEYHDRADRRFHAQPVACNNCGPYYELYINGKAVSRSPEMIINRVCALINDGRLVLIKGMGGMHIACDPFNVNAVARLRSIKRRDGKPFAVMFRDAESAAEYADISAVELKSLDSWQRPIVLLKKKDGHDSNPLCPDLTSNLNLIGVMLPYMPFHHLLFRILKVPALVFTSGNFSSEPIITANEEALKLFTDHVDAVVLHNREIWNRTDDSVTRIIDAKQRIFRRSRGYVPSPVRVGSNADGIIAFGAELTNCFCVGRGTKAFMSQHIGDLQNLETTFFYTESLERFIKLFRIKPSLLVADMHPDYISTRTALTFDGCPLTFVQHHHAHIASCMAENSLDETVIGVAFDGTGYGSDGKIWGSEFLICDLNDFRRISHFEYIPLPGGDMATEEPWRTAVSWLYKIYGEDYLNLDIPVIRETDSESLRMISMMIDKGINCPLSSGAGRLFDAVASITGIVQKASFQAEAPMRLEALASDNIKGHYPYKCGSLIDLDNTISAVVDDVINGTNNMTIATLLHNTIILIIFDTVVSVRIESGLNKVVLSGGVFQNKYLLEGTVKKLTDSNFEVYTHSVVPSNDGGLALGQLAVAAKRRELKCV